MKYYLKKKKKPHLCCLFVAYMYPSGDHSSSPFIRFSAEEKRNFVYGETEIPSKVKCLSPERLSSRKAT